MLHKRIAYHLQKLQKKDSKEESRKASVPERQSETGERDRVGRIKDIVGKWKLTNNAWNISVFIKPPYAHMIFKKGPCKSKY